MKQLEKVYDPKQVEEKIYKMWEDGGYFTAHIDPEKKPFTIVIPPPNVTGQLHLGHAFDNTIQDILIRYKRMQGYPTLWVPGTDHAGIATQIRVEQELRESEGISRYDLGREKFVERVWKWKHEYGGRIVEQLRRLGSSCDWSRERFTMDDGCSKAVREVFVSLYEKKLIYKGNRIINWCPKCRTALSDAEVEHEEKDGSLYHLRYPIMSSSEYLVVATTRPETMLGDTAVAVHPDDERYSHLVGKSVLLPLVEREIPIVADEFVDRDFGTGCVKVTPSHDPNDFELGLRHNLEQILIFDEDALVINSGKYNGMERYVTRKQVLDDLDKLGLLQGTEPHKMNVGICHRCHTVVEPITSDQWFVKMKPLSEEAIRVVKDGTIKYVPDRFSKIYIHWMENVRDWCISRQLWWGHRIPAWYCPCGHVTVSRDDVEACEKCGSLDIKQDEDVLDTWFSSALWPFSTLGWPDETDDLKYFYPTDVLVTGYDIIFFWVARMIFSGMEHMKREPFHTVFIHGMIRDAQGRKMSKSLNNGIDPMDIIESFGADALRFYIVTGNAPGSDMRYFPEKCEAMRNFANKIWNAARFVMMNLEQSGKELKDLVLTDDEITNILLSDCSIGKADTVNTVNNYSSEQASQSSVQANYSPNFDTKTCADSSDNDADSRKNDTVCIPYLFKLEDKWIISRLNTLKREVSINLDKYELGLAAAKLYDFIWDDFCDWYIELAKPRLANIQLTTSASQCVDGNSGGNSAANDPILHVLVNVLTDILTLLHPFMPFITEEIYLALFGDELSRIYDGSECTADDVSAAGRISRVLMLRSYPIFNEYHSLPQPEADFESIKTVISTIRSQRASMNVPPSKKTALIIVTEKENLYKTGISYIGRLAYASEVTVTDTPPSDLSGYVTLSTDDTRLFLPLSELVDFEKERERIGKEIENTQKLIESTERKLSNEQFVSKAKPHVVEAEREKLEKARALLTNLELSLDKM